MAWIESHQELGAHPKTQKLARLLGISRPAAVGHLQFLWWWALDYAQDGNLSRFEALDIAIGGQWEGDSDEFVSALERSEFLDRNDSALTIHDWEQYAGRIIERRRQDAERKRAARNVQGTSGGQDADVHETAHVTVPNRTVPNQTEPDNEVPTEPAQTPPVADSLPSSKNEGRVYALVDAFAQVSKRRPQQIQGRERRETADAFRPLVDDATPDDVIGCAVYLRTDDFWRKPGTLTARKLAQTIPEWIAGGRPAQMAKARASPNGRSAIDAAIAELEQRR